MPLNQEDQKIYARQHYKENKEKYINKRRELRARYQKEYHDYQKTLSCSECGENHVACIEFHHLNPELKEFNISRKAGYGPLKTLMSEIEKCIILCSNCHRKLHYEIEERFNY